MTECDPLDNNRRHTPVVFLLPTMYLNAKDIQTVTESKYDLVTTVTQITSPTEMVWFEMDDRRTSQQLLLESSFNIVRRRFQVTTSWCWMSACKAFTKEQGGHFEELDLKQLGLFFLDYRISLHHSLSWTCIYVRGRLGHCPVRKVMMVPLSVNQIGRHVKAKCCGNHAGKVCPPFRLGHQQLKNGPFTLSTSKHTAVRSTNLTFRLIRPKD